MNGRERFLHAAKGEHVDRPPVWFMRQAGRYLPEYMALRERYPFEEAVRRPDVASEITLQPIRRLDVDAAVIFSDILVPFPGMGRKVTFGNGGPRVDPIVLPSQVDNLAVPDPEEHMGFVLETIRRVREAIPDKAVLGFAGAPFTLAAYLLEGGGSKDFAATKRFMYQEPEAFDRLLATCADTIAWHLQAQMDAGADAIQIFDTWAENLALDEYRDIVMPHVKSVIRRVRGKGKPVILFARGTSHLLPALKECGADVLSVDWRVRLEDVAKEVPGIALQGNMDPTRLLAPVKRVEEETRKVLEDGANVKAGHIFNLGHGVLPSTPVECAEAMVRTVQSWTR